MVTLADRRPARAPRRGRRRRSLRSAASHGLPLPMMDISSTEMRARVAAGESIAGLVPPAVASYIERHHLYR